MKLYVKYMVSHRCKMLVKDELKKLGIECVVVDLGVAEVCEDITSEQRDQLKNNLKKSGLDLLDDKRSILVESIKVLIIEMVHYTDEEPIINFSRYISETLDYDYTYLANVFSEVKGITIQQFIILNKIEKAKEILLYDRLSIKEIAYKLNYSSLSHFSKQFKKITGLTPAYYRGIANKRRRNLEDL
ncbi:MAG: helix-turn-helix domain-containing protein [Bacteroidota bacterium]